VNAANRVLWVAIGLLLTAAGVTAVLAYLGVLPGVHRADAVVGPATLHRWHVWGAWLPAGVAVAGLILAIAGGLMIRGELRRRGGTAMTGLVIPHPEGGPAGGAVRVDGETLRRALQRDLLTDPLIRRAAVRLTGHPATPRLQLRLDVAPGSDVTAVHTSVQHALDRFQRTTRLRPTISDTDVRVG
jgi:hypothetical protein